MATRSAAKAHRQSLKRRLRNRAVQSVTKTAIKNADAAIAAGDPESARQAVRHAISALDRAAKKGVFHPNSVARRKSRLILKFNAAVAAFQSVAQPVVREEKAPIKKRAVRRKKAKQ
ncbi:MAG: 30S ribosomal protein S20 [Dehalococcoidia bacterium]